ncbi:MAG: hypothetical protein AMXMBFR46_18130 [Acidimicrobiia bacterium]
MSDDTTPHDDSEGPGSEQSTPIPDLRVWPFLDRLHAEDVHAASNALNRHGLRELADLLQVPDVVLTRHDSAARALRRRLRRSSPATILRAAGLLAETTREMVVDALGPTRSEDPTVADLIEVLPEVVREHGPRRVALLLAVAVDARWTAATVCATLLDVDSRFQLDVLGPVASDEPAAARPKSGGSEADAELRERRRARKKQARNARSSEQGTRRRYRRRRDSHVPDDGAGSSEPQPSPATVTLDGHPVPRHEPERRPVRIVHAFPDINRDDALVGRIVLTNIRFNDSEGREKDRPCVVVAASGRHHLVVRTCYSEGGVRTSDFRAVPVSDLKVAGLDRPTFVLHEERRIPRAAIKAKFGWLPVADWNQL